MWIVLHAEHRLDSLDQGVNLEGFRDIAISAAQYTLEYGFARRLCGQHDDRQFLQHRVLAHFVEYVEAIDICQPDIQQDQIRCVANLTVLLSCS
jgi:hypothetical protein